MRFISITTVAVTAALSLAGSVIGAPTERQCPLVPTTGPFYITVEPADGSASYPTDVQTVSRAVDILSSATSYHHQFTFDVLVSSVSLPLIVLTFCRTTKRVTPTHLPSSPSWSISPGQVFVFGLAGGVQVELEQVVKNCKIYLVKAGTGVSGINGWWSTPSTGFAVGIQWEGAGSSEANAALRLHTTLP